jgi:hypothetical protein
MAFFGSRISDNMYRTKPEGYLVCRAVPISRTGFVEYSPSELGIDSDRPVVRVYRSPEELFSPATIASFEGKSITDGHPPEDVTADNFGVYEKGHIQNVRRGEEELESGEIPLLADLIIKDRDLANRIEPKDGQREVSIGYKNKIAPYGTEFQAIDLRGNHLASVPKGRAGHEVRIRDSAPNLITTRTNKHMAQTANKKTIFGKMLKAFAGTDAEPEEVAEAAQYSPEAQTGDESVAAPAVETGKNPLDERLTKLEDAMTKLCSQMDELCKPKTGTGDEDPDLIEEEEAVAGDESVSAPAVEPGENPLGDSFRANLLALKPLVAASKDKSMIDAYNHALRSTRKPGKQSGRDGYKVIGKVAATRSADAERAAQDATAQRNADLAKILADKRKQAFTGVTQ